MEIKCTKLKISLKLKTPLHIGEFERGVLAKTKRYIPSKNLWAALTSVITKDIMKEYSPALYQVIGSIVKERCNFTYFYLDDLTEKKIYFPYFNSRGFQYLKCNYDLKKSELISPREYTQKYIGSQIMTAIDHDKFTHKDESLHEEEFIYAKNIAMTGYLYFRPSEASISEMIKDKVAEGTMSARYNYESLVKMCYEDKRSLKFDENQIINWIKLLKYEGIGGHRKRGFGKVQVIDPEKILEDTWFDREIMLKDKESKTLIKVAPLLEQDFHMDYIKNKHKVNEHLLLMPISIDQLRKLEGKVSFYGDLKPLVGREWGSFKTNEKTHIGAGQKVNLNMIAATVGSTLKLIDGLVK